MKLAERLRTYANIASPLAAYPLLVIFWAEAFYIRAILKWNDYAFLKQSNFLLLGAWSPGLPLIATEGGD